MCISIQIQGVCYWLNYNFEDRSTFLILILFFNVPSSIIVTVVIVGGGCDVFGGRPPNMENDIVKGSVGSTTRSSLIGI